MKSRLDRPGFYIVSLEKGDDIRASVEKFALENGIKGAELSAIGAILNPELAYYDLESQKYLPTKLPGIWELSPLVGNITLKDRKPFMHAHVALSDKECNMRGGHLNNAEVGVVVEMTIRAFSEPLIRKLNKDIGLPRWEPSHELTC